MKIDQRARSFVCCGRVTTALVAVALSSVPGSQSRSTCPAHRLTTVASTSSPRRRSWFSCISTRQCVTESRVSEQTLNTHWSVWLTSRTTSTALDASLTGLLHRLILINSSNNSLLQMPPLWRYPIEEPTHPDFVLSTDDAYCFSFILVWPV